MRCLLDDFIDFFIAKWINFKVSYKDTYYKRAPLEVSRAPLVFVILLHHCLQAATNEKGVVTRGVPTVKYALDNLKR